MKKFHSNYIFVIDFGFYVFSDPTEFYNRNDIAEVPETGSDMIETHKFTFLLTGVSVAILILIFAIVFNQLQ